MVLHPRILSLPHKVQRDFSAVTSDALLSAFGPSRYTDADQAAAPDEPRTRLVKDVLKIGKWSTNAGPWDVSGRLLATIEKNSRSLIANGTAINLVKTHHPKPAEIHPDDLIAPIDAVAVIGDTLYVTTYVTASQAEYLRNPARKVSVREADSWEDGSGHKYGPVLLHVAVVDLPVVGGQKPFTDLSKSSTRHAKRDLAMDFEALKTALNALLTGFGAAELPEEVTEENLVPILTGMAAAMGVSEKGGDRGSGADGAGEGTPPEMGEMSKQLSAAINAALEPHLKRIKDLSAKVTELQADKSAGVKAAFDAELTTLCEAGDIDAATRTELEKHGQRLGYDLALLNGYRGRRMVDMGSGAKRFRDPNPKNTDGRLTDEQVAEKLKAKGLPPISYR